MKDLFSGVRIYVYAYLAVTLRNVNLHLAQNVNLHSHSECRFALILRNQASLTSTLHKHIGGEQRSWGGGRVGGGGGHNLRCIKA